jgi:glycosyltransferase involved in cell wall biosynthesis
MILIISGVFPPEPVVAALLAKDLAESIAKNYRVMVITPKPTRPLGFSFSGSSRSIGEFEHIVLDSYTYPKSRMLGRLRESFSFGMHSSRHIKMNRDEIQCCYVSAWPLIGQYLIIRTLKKFSIPSVLHIQDIYPESLSNKIPLFGKIIKTILLPLDKYILKNSSKVIANSENMCNEFKRSRGVDRNKIEIIRNWRCEDEFLKPGEADRDRWRSGIGDKSFVFMYLGNIGPVAGVDFLIKSFVKADAANAVLIIAGCGQEKQNCIKLAESFNNSDIIFWDVPSGEEPSVQKAADVMLLPVRPGAAMSSVPSKLIAYMFSGKPVIACVDEESDSAAAVREANCGWVTPPGNIDELAALMKETASRDHEFLSALGGNGLQYARKHYSVKNNLPKLVAVINEAMNSRTQPARV